MDWSQWTFFLDSRHRLVLVLSVLVGMLATMAVGFFCYNIYNLEVENAWDEVGKVSLIMEREIESNFRHLDLMLLDLKTEVESHAGLQSFAKDQLWHLASVKAKQLPEIMNVAFFNAEGKIVASNDGSGVGIDIQDREYFQFHHRNRETRLFISRPLVGRVNGLAVLALTRRINDSHGNFAGGVVISIALDDVTSEFSQISKNKKGEHIGLYTLDGHYLLARNPAIEEGLGKSFADQPLHQLISSSGVSDGFEVSVSDIDHQEKLFSYRVSHRLGLVVVAGVSKDAILKSAREKIFSVLALYVLITVFCILLLYRYLQVQITLEKQKVQLVQNSKMSALGEMAGGIAHEINNPLTIIKGRAEQLSRLLQRSEIDLPKAMLIVEGIEKTTVRISSIIKGLRSFSRSGESDPMSVAYVADLVGASLELCREKFKNSNVDLRIQDFPSVAIQCRETQISQVVLNLLGNSYDAIVSFEKPWVEISCKEYAQSVEIIITDSGRGISPEIEAKIMQPFFTTKPVGKGTGLGLSISKGIIEDHHGKLFLNRGSENTQFVISLPKAKLKQEAAAA